MKASKGIIKRLCIVLMGAAGLIVAKIIGATACDFPVASSLCSNIAMFFFSTVSGILILVVCGLILYPLYLIIKYVVIGP